MTDNHYIVLGIETDADFATMRRAYRARALETHPDRFSGDPTKAEEFKRIAIAFNTLSDPISRRDYDLLQGALNTDLPPSSDTASRRPEDAGSILDTYVDDTLEELIVGNTVPANSSLQTLMLDLEQTTQFCLFREAKTSLYEGRIQRADALFRQYLTEAPDNILARYFHAQCCIKLNRWNDAANELRVATLIGSTRAPPLRLTRIRRELSDLRRRRPGFLGTLYRLFVPADRRRNETPDDEQERNALNRAINRLARERLTSPKSHKRLNG